MTIVGKIAGEGSVQIFGRVEGELHASTVLISQGAEVEGDIVADDLTVGGRVKGTVHANRVKLNSTAVVEGDIFHRSLSIEENARFEGSSRREDAEIDAPRIPLGRSPSQFPGSSVSGQSHGAAAEVGQKRNGAPENGVHISPAVG
jgi:cytoskeletal protein CcmA (bactofilin family)